MQKQTFYRYDLIQSDIPEIADKKVIVKDAYVGGIKLRYKVSTVKALVFNLFNKQKIIQLPRLSFHKSAEEIKTFLRPYKNIWDVSRNKLPKCLWGNPKEVLTNLWIELELDYKDIKSGIILPKKEIRDTNITKHLTKNKKLFYIVKKTNQVKSN